MFRLRLGVGTFEFTDTNAVAGAFLVARYNSIVEVKSCEGAGILADDGATTSVGWPIWLMSGVIRTVFLWEAKVCRTEVCFGIAEETSWDPILGVTVDVVGVWILVF